VHANPAPHLRGEVVGYMEGAHSAQPGNVDFNPAARAPVASSHALHHYRQSSMQQQHAADAAHVYARPRTTTGIISARSPSPSEKQPSVILAAGPRRASTLSSVSPAVVHSEYRRPVHQQLFSDLSSAIDQVGLPSPCPPPAPSRGESVILEPSASRPLTSGNLDNSNSRMELTTMRSSNRASGNVLSRSSSAEMLNEMSLLRSKLSLATAKAASLELRVNQLESSLQNERDAYQTLMLQHQRLQVDYDKQFAEQRKIAEHNAPESIIVYNIPDEKELSKELEKARAEASHYRSEYEKVVLSSSSLAAKVSHASSDVQSIMEQQSSRFEEQRKKDMQQIDMLKNQKDAMQDRLNFLQSELDSFRESLISSRDTRSRATPPLQQQSPTKSVFIGRSIDLDESSRFVRHIALQQLHSFSNLPGFVGVGIRVKEVLEGGSKCTIITEMLPNMSASDSGAINLGDSLLAIDSKSISGLSLEQIRDLTVGPRGTLVSLKLSRNGRVFTVSSWNYFLVVF
jgi:predicted  nucleic acid-binding Zn-ribbon protein